MNKLKLINSRELIKNISDTVYQNDNKITAVHICLPNKIGDYYRRTCSVELRAILPNGNYLPYVIDTNKESSVWYIENDLTERPQTVKLMMVITRAGNVIGRTNAVEFTVIAPEETVNPLTPREYADQRIAELEGEVDELTEDNQELENTIAEKDEIIAEKDTEISGLNTQVANLQTQSTNLSNQNETYRETIQNMIDNPPQPKLYIPPEPIIPESETRVYTPPQNYDGYASFTVKSTSLINPELDVFFKREVPINLTFNQQIVFASICLGNEMIRIVNFLEKVKTIASTAFANCSGIVEVNFSIGLETIEGSAFAGCRNLVTVTLPEGIKSLAQDSLGNCANLKNVYLPNSITLAHAYVFRNSSALQNVTLQNGFNCSINLSSSTLYSAETIVSWLEALADRTGQTAYTLTMGTTNLNKLTNEQKAIAINKNWNLA